MDRKVETSLYEILTILYTIRDEQGTVGWSIREDLADMLAAPPTEAEVRWFLDERARKTGRLTTSEALEKFAGDEEAIDDIWYETAHDEAPIAEFFYLWDSNDVRCDVHKSDRGAVWLVTPEKYRS